MNKDALKILLKDVKTIAIVGVSSNPDRDSFKVMKYLKEYGYDVYPVNPNLQNTQILGENCYSTLNDIHEEIDMVDIFRAVEFIPDIAREAINIKAKIFWTQLGLFSKDAASIAKNAHRNGTTLKTEAIKSKLITKSEYEKIVDPKKMTQPS